MKKLISLALAALMLVSVLVSCAPTAERVSENITVASSDALQYAEWLNARIRRLPTKIVMGVSSSEAYGVDMEGFENDGYIIRTMGNQTLIFGKTGAGLDKAVRIYAKAAEAGNVTNIDAVYHEGYRIEKLTIAGRDISEFTVTYNYDRDSVVSGSTVKTLGNAKYAAEELVRLVAKATGITLTAVPNTESVSAPVIAIDYITDGSRGENGFSYEVKDGNLYINGAPEANGCTNGVYYFLEYECGWDALMYGDSDLQDADLVDVPEGVFVSIDPIFDSVNLYRMFDKGFVNDRSAFSQNYNGVIAHACHGMQSYNWSGTCNPWYQICHTDEGNYLNTFDAVLEYVEQAVDAGAVIGETFTTIDISQSDNLNYCTCHSCLQTYKAEGNAHSGAVVRFANRLAEDIEAEGYGGLKYQIFAYHGSNIPCITLCRDDVYVTLCNDGSCQNHPLDGSQCEGSSFDMAGMLGFGQLNNKNYAEWMRGWGAICKNVYLWHYALDCNFHQYTYFKEIYSDLMLMKESNLKGLFLEQENWGLGLGRLRLQLFNALIYNPNVTEEGYNVLRDRIMRREFGDGYKYIIEYVDLWDSTEQEGCWNCWGYGNFYGADSYNIARYSELSNQMYDLLEKARLACGSNTQELAVKRLLMEVCYRQCMTSYFKAYDAEDRATLKFLGERYDLFVQYMTENGYNIHNFPFSLGGGQKDLSATLHGAAWDEWVEFRDLLTPEGSERRPDSPGAPTLEESVVFSDETRDGKRVYRVTRVDKKENIDWSTIPAAPIDRYSWRPGCEEYVAYARVVFAEDFGFVCQMTCLESDPAATYTKFDDAVCFDSCMEFFVDFTGEGYFNLEANALGTECMGYGPSRSSRKSLSTKLTGGFDTYPAIGDEVWTLTYELPIEKIKIFCPDVEASMFVSGYEFTGNFYKTGSKDITGSEHYGMWNEIKTETPDFHQPAEFGIFIME